MTVRFEAFKTGFWGNWRAAMEEAAVFASSIGTDRVISISHSHFYNVHIITVWYRAAALAPVPAGKRDPDP